MTTTTILVVRATGQGEYAVSVDGVVLANGRGALSSALSCLQFGLTDVDTFIVHNADTGAESPAFRRKDYPSLRREGMLPLPETRREEARRRRVARFTGSRSVPIGHEPTRSANLPPIWGRSGVTIDQRFKPKTLSPVRQSR